MSPRSFVIFVLYSLEILAAVPPVEVRLLLLIESPMSSCPSSIDSQLEFRRSQRRRYISISTATLGLLFQLFLDLICLASEMLMNDIFDCKRGCSSRIGIKKHSARDLHAAHGLVICSIIALLTTMRLMLAL